MSKRSEQVAGLIQHKLNGIINREIEWPEGVMITITKVEISADLKYAKIWLVCTPEEKTGMAYGVLRDKNKKLRNFLSQELTLHVVPKITFRVDKAGQAVEEVEKLLQKIKDEE